MTGIHPSLDYPRCVELSEQVRLYARALISTYGITPFKYQKNKVEFGVILTKKEKKRQKRLAKGAAVKVKKKTSRYPWLYASKPAPSPAQLARLAEQAGLALAEAGKLAGEPVIYCCGYIRKEKGYDCKADCINKQHYQIIRRNDNGKIQLSNKDGADKQGTLV